MFRKILGKNRGEYLYFVFRVLVGFLFFMHGSQKLFGFFGGTQVELISLFGLAGFIEFFGGLAVVLGLFTRLAAFFNSLLMLIAYFMAHNPQGYNPISNGGEVATLYFAAFLAIFVFGARKFSLERAVLGKEIF